MRLPSKQIRRYVQWYCVLLRGYPEPFRERFGEGMRQTFGDLLYERAEEGRGIRYGAFAMFVETSLSIIHEQYTYMIMQQRTVRFVLGALALLIIPLIATQLQIGGWDWDGTDYAVMAVLLTGAGAAAALATNAQYPLKRRLTGVAIVGFLFILYVHLAVGIVDTWPLAGS